MISFDLFGFDIGRTESLYGFWFFNIKNWEKEVDRSLLSIYYDYGTWHIDFCFFKILGD